MNQKKYDIFISYHREEREKARAIAEMLVVHGYDVWWDIDFLPGDKFPKEIDEVIKNASVAIVMWSKKAVASDFIRAEANRANSNNILISVKLDECEIPIPYNIQHFLDLSSWDNDADSPLLIPLLGAVEKKIGSRSNKTLTKKKIEEKIDQLKDEETEQIDRLVPQRTTRTLQLPDIKWIKVPAGNFLYGEDNQTQNLDRFYISKYPITNSQYQTFVDDGGYNDKRWWKDLGKREFIESQWPQPNRPKTNVNWYEALAFTRWISSQLGYKVSLPIAVRLASLPRNPSGWITNASRRQLHTSRLNLWVDWIVSS